jgi:hypothetical protein
MEFSNEASATMTASHHRDTHTTRFWNRPEGALVVFACSTGQQHRRVTMTAAKARDIVRMRQTRIRPDSIILTRPNLPTTVAAVAGLGEDLLDEAVLTMLQHASRNTRLSGAICPARPTPRPRSTACASLRPTRLSPSHGSGTSLASSARSRRPTVRSSP